MTHNHIHSRNLEIDHLRGVAIILTLIRHWTFGGFSQPSTSWLLNGGWAGVDLFFVISGFVVSQSLISKTDQLLKSPSYLLRGFYTNRIFRLLPVSLFWIALQWLAAISLGDRFGQPNQIIHETFFILTYCYNYAITHGVSSTLDIYWSLSIEEQFYLIYPLFLLSVVTFKKRLFWVALLWLIAPFVRIAFAGGLPLWPNLLSPTHFRLDTISAGCLLFLILSAWKNELSSKVPRISTLMKALTFWTLSLGIAAIAAFANPTHSIGLSLLNLLCLVLVFLGALQQGWVTTGNFYLNRVFIWIGERSYSLYLLHIFIYKIVQQFFPEMGVLAIPLALSAAHFSYLWIEIPTQKLGKALAKKIFSQAPHIGHPIVNT